MLIGLILEMKFETHHQNTSKHLISKVYYSYLLLKQNIYVIKFACFIHGYIVVSVHLLQYLKYNPSGTLLLNVNLCHTFF